MHCVRSAFAFANAIRQRRIKRNFEWERGGGRGGGGALHWAAARANAAAGGGGVRRGTGPRPTPETALFSLSLWPWSTTCGASTSSLTRRSSAGLTFTSAPDQVGEQFFSLILKRSISLRLLFWLKF